MKKLIVLLMMFISMNVSAQYVFYSPSVIMTFQSYNAMYQYYLGLGYVGYGYDMVIYNYNNVCYACPGAFDFTLEDYKRYKIIADSLQQIDILIHQLQTKLNGYELQLKKGIYTTERRKKELIIMATKTRRLIYELRGF
jgi:hypothetical protein